MTREPSKMEVRSAMQRMKNGLTPELIKESLMLWTSKPDEDYIDGVVAAAARRLCLRYRCKYKDRDPSELTDRQIRPAVWQFRTLNLTPEAAKSDAKRWLGPYANCEWIDMVVDEAARRLGLGPRECLGMKMSDDSGRMELATNQMTKMDRSPDQVKKMLERWIRRSDGERMSAAIDEAARRLGLAPHECLGMKMSDDSGRMELATNLMTKMDLSPNQAEKMLAHLTREPDGERMSAAIDEVARRLGLGPDETLLDKEREQQ